MEGQAARGVVAVSSTLLVGGIALAAGLGRVVAGAAFGHGRSHDTRPSNAGPDASSAPI